MRRLPARDYPIPPSRRSRYGSAAETKDENDFCLQTFGLRPVDYLGNMIQEVRHALLIDRLCYQADEITHQDALYWAVMILHCLT
jgi:hypothetical protein